MALSDIWPKGVEIAIEGGRIAFESLHRTVGLRVLGPPLRADPPLPEHTILSAAPGLAHCFVGDDVVILDLHKGKYFGLHLVGARVWAFVQTPLSVAEVLDRLTEEFDVARDRCALDLACLITSLREAGLLDVRVARAAPKA